MNNSSQDVEAVVVVMPFAPKQHKGHGSCVDVFSQCGFIPAFMTTTPVSATTVWRYAVV